MSSSFRRFEMLLPVRYNDGSLIPDAVIGETIADLRTKFGAVSIETQLIHGVWTHDKQIFHDDLIRVYVDVSDTVQNRRYFEKFKQRLKKRFRQIDIWMTTYPIEAV